MVTLTVQRRKMLRDRDSIEFWGKFMEFFHKLRHLFFSCYFLGVVK